MASALIAISETAAPTGTSARSSPPPSKPTSPSRTSNPSPSPAPPPARPGRPCPGLDRHRLALPAPRRNHHAPPWSRQRPERIPHPNRLFRSHSPHRVSEESFEITLENQTGTDQTFSVEHLYRGDNHEITAASAEHSPGDDPGLIQFYVPAGAGSEKSFTYTSFAKHLVSPSTPFQTETARPRQILVCGLNWLGDAILAMPALQVLHFHHADADHDADAAWPHPVMGTA